MAKQLKRMSVAKAFDIEFARASADDRVVLSSMMGRYLSLRKELTDVIRYVTNDKKTVFGDEMLELFKTLLFGIDETHIDIVVGDDNE